MNSVAAQVLLVEDDPMIVEMLEGFFQPTRLTLSHATNSAEALCLVNDKPVDLVLLDLGLPGLDGFQFLREIKISPKTSDIPVIVLSGRSDTVEKVRGLELGAFDYQTKPFDATELRTRVFAALRDKEKVDALK